MNKRPFENTNQTNNEKRKRTKCLLVESFTTPKQESLFENGTFYEDLDFGIVDTLLESDVLKRKGTPNEGEVSKLRELFSLNGEAIHYPN